MCESIDQILRDRMGEITIDLSGFGPILPVIVKGTIADEIRAWLKSSRL